MVEALTYLKAFGLVGSLARKKKKKRKKERKSEAFCQVSKPLDTKLTCDASTCSHTSYNSVIHVLNQLNIL